MNYTPKHGDTIHRDGHEPITILKLTEATAQFKRVDQVFTEPRELFDPALERAFATDGTRAMRDGVQVYPEPEVHAEPKVSMPPIPPSHTWVYRGKGFVKEGLEGIAHCVDGAEEAYGKCSPGLFGYNALGSALLHYWEAVHVTGVSGSHNAHARLSPSSSKTWTNCTLAPAYVEANRHRIPKDSGSIYSNEGTEAHDHASDVLLHKKTLDQVPEEMRDPVGTYVDHCLALVPDGVSYQVEVSIPLFYQPDESGTCDFAIVTDDRVTVRDYKHGAGVLVTSEGNTQLAIYAYSLIKTLEDIYEFTDDTVIDIKVVQPRHREADADEPWVLPLSEFREFCLYDVALQAELATKAVDAVRAAGFVEGEDVPPHEIEKVIGNIPAEFTPQEGDEGSCRWCKAKAFCGVRHAHTTGDGITSATLALMPDLTKEDRKGEPLEVIEAQVVTDVPAHLELGGTLTLDYLLGVFRNRKKIEKFLTDVEEYLENLAREQPIPGLKWVEGRAGNRAWVDEEAAENFCRNQKLKLEERAVSKLKSPTQIEALLKDKLKNVRTRNRFEELVTRSDGRPVLVPEDDKRAAIGNVMPNLTTEEDI
jgi:hypothetical protein